jgi:hypothetical protein
MSLYDHDTNVTVRSGSIKLATIKLNSAIQKLETWFENGVLKLTLVKAPS